MDLKFFCINIKKGKFYLIKRSIITPKNNYLNNLIPLNYLFRYHFALKEIVKINF